ncbi:MAG: hypothetical protein GC205_10515 [Bacteroidetes bacterium]|nr:hypothetical protein [Bacteroidota bacterium]
MMIVKRLQSITFRKVGRYGLYLMLGLLVSTGMPACKAKEKAAQKEAAALLAKQTEQAKKDLISLLSDNNTKSLEEKERDLQAIKDLGLTDPEVLKLIEKVEAKLAAEREALRNASTNTGNTELQAKQRALGSAMAAISGARSVEEANRKISETLKLFSSPDAPLLIVIAEENGQKDFDRPSTIRLYLEYLKDTGNAPDALSNLTMDNNGLISEVELIKR